MHIKTATSGLIAGAVLFVSLVLGTAAQVGTGVNLENNSAGSCSVAATGSGNFGTYKWDAASSSYRPATASDGTAAIALTVTQTIGVGVTCDVSVSGTPLTNGPTNVISVDRISVAADLEAPQTLTTQSTVLKRNVVGAMTARLTLTNPGANPPGTYVGTITFTAATGS